MHQSGGQPAISIDAKKKEQLGQLPNPGWQWRPASDGDPVRVEDHSFYFIGPDVDVAIPFGIYDLAHDSGWVNGGTDHDTSVFAARRSADGDRCIFHDRELHRTIGSGP